MWRYQLLFLRHIAYLFTRRNHSSHRHLGLVARMFAIVMLIRMNPHLGMN